MLTTNINLGKPVRSDTVGTWLDAMNSNSDILDTEIGKLRAIQLYDGGESGTTGTVTLTDSASNYTAIEIFFNLNGAEWKSVKVRNPNGKVVSLDGQHLSSGVLQSIYATVAISGNTITPQLYGFWNFNTSENSSSTNYVHVLSVIGYRA